MKEQKVVFSCDHKLNILKTETRIFVMDPFNDTIRNLQDGSEISLIYHIDKIFYVYTGANTESYINGVDYILDPDRPNSIKWLTVNKPDRTYYCEALVRYRYVKNFVEDPQNCERCNGMGWYVSPMSTAYQRFETAENVTKLVQDYIKIVYTKYDESTQYGCDILDYVGREVVDERSFTTDVCMELEYAAERLKTLQQNGVDNGDEYTDEELLSEIEINETEYDKEAMGLYINMTIYSVAGTSARFSLKL